MRCMAAYYSAASFNSSCMVRSMASMSRECDGMLRGKGSESCRARIRIVDHFRPRLPEMQAKLSVAPPDQAALLENLAGASGGIEHVQAVLEEFEKLSAIRMCLRDHEV